VPGLAGTLHQWDVSGILVVRLADDARVAMRAALVVADGELFEADDGHAAASELPDGGGAHASESDDDDVRPAHGRGSLNPVVLPCRMCPVPSQYTSMIVKASGWGDRG